MSAKKAAGRPAIPLLPMPWKQAREMVGPFRPFSNAILRLFPHLDDELRSVDNELGASDYVSGTLLASTAYASAVVLVMGIYVVRTKGLGDPLMLALSLAAGGLVFGMGTLYSLIYPHWTANQKTGELERHLLFAVRHMRIQTSAGVPLFDALVSVSEDDDPTLGYGLLAGEFKKIVAEVRSGKNLSEALEQSAEMNVSQYYRRLLWQLSNAHKAGVEIKQVLADMQEFLTNEQSVLVRDYGAQLNPLALFYMISTIIAPTMGLIFMMVASSFVALPVSPPVLMGILAAVVVIQFMFMGLIKSRRPKVAL